MEFARVSPSNCEVQEEFENISKLTRSAATEVASGERLRKFHETSRYREKYENIGKLTLSTPTRREVDERLRKFH